MNGEEEQEFLTVAQIARKLQVSKNLVYFWIKSGQLRAYRVGNQTTRVRFDDLERFLKERRTEEF